MDTADMDPDSPKTYGLTLPICMTVAAFCAIAWFNFLELQFRVWWRFKQYKGLYFWSLVVASFGTMLHPLSFLMLDFRIWKNAQITGIVIGISWWAMVTGQALVLYSRLYLVVRDRRKIRWVLAMIITNVFILHIPITVVSQMAYSSSPQAPKWMQVYKVYEKVQMTGFTIQETIISGLYLWETRRILRPGKAFQRAKTREVMWHLTYVNIFIIFLDAALLATEYANLFTIQTVFKAAVYSVKLRLEFVVLNQLMEYVQGRSSTFERSADTPSHQNGGNGINSRSRNISIPLESVKRPGYHHHLQRSDRPADGRTESGHNYSVTASKGAVSPMGLRSPDGGVLRTTEVHVVHGEPHLEELDEKDETQLHGIFPTKHGHGHGEVVTTVAPRTATTATTRDGSSRSSSIVEFAGKGGDFAGKAI